MTKNRILYEREARYDAMFFPKFPITLTKGQGATVWDAMDQEYLDCTSSFGVMGVGYSNPLVQERITSQLDKMTTCHQLYSNDVRCEFLEKLMMITPTAMEKVYLCNSGTEAVEAAIKVAVAVTGKTKFAACTGSFHGLTIGSTGLVSNEAQRIPFKKIIHEARFINRDDIDSLQATIDEDTALFFVELIQANDGATVLSREFIRAARELTAKTGTLMVIDEVCTGFCRTGNWFATPQYGIIPDCITIAKSFGGGLPFGALLMKEEIASRFPKRLHSNTFGGNPLVLAAGLGAIEFAESEKLWEKARYHGEKLRKYLESIPNITRIKGKGLLIGIDFNTDSQTVTQHLLEKHRILVIPRAKGILFMPPLVITKNEVERIGKAVRKTFESPTKAKISAVEFYTKIADEYDSLAISKTPYLDESVKILKKYNHFEGSLLDIGCGTGLLKQMLGEHFEYTGIEPTPNMAKSARNRGYHQVIVGASEEVLPQIPDKSYDIVVALGSLLYVQDIESVMKHLRRIAKKAFLITLDDVPGDFIRNFACKVYNHSRISVPDAKEDYRLFAWRSPSLDIPVYCRLIYVYPNILV